MDRPDTYDSLVQRARSGDADAATALLREARRRHDTDATLLAACVLDDLVTLQHFVRAWCRDPAVERLAGAARWLGLDLDAEAVGAVQRVLDTTQARRRARCLDVAEVLGAALIARRNPLGLAVVDGGARLGSPGALSTVALAVRVDGDDVVVGAATTFASNPTPGRVDAWRHELAPWRPALDDNLERARRWAARQDADDQVRLAGCPLEVEPDAQTPSSPHLGLFELVARRIDAEQRWTGVCEVLERLLDPRRGSPRLDDPTWRQAIEDQAERSLTGVDDAVRALWEEDEHARPLARCCRGGGGEDLDIGGMTSLATLELDVDELGAVLDRGHAVDTVFVDYGIEDEAWPTLLEATDLLAGLRRFAIGGAVPATQQPWLARLLAQCGPLTSLRLGRDTLGSLDASLLGRHPLVELDVWPETPTVLRGVLDALSRPLERFTLVTPQDVDAQCAMVELLVDHPMLAEVHTLNLAQRYTGSPEWTYHGALLPGPADLVRRALDRLDALHVAPAEPGVIARMFTEEPSPRLRWLSIVGHPSLAASLDGTDLEALCRAPMALERLDLERAALAAAELAALGAGGPALQRLRRLALRHCELDAARLGALIHHMALPALEELDLSHSQLDTASARALAAWPGLAQLRALFVEPGNATARGVLDALDPRPADLAVQP